MASNPFFFLFTCRLPIVRDTPSWYTLYGVFRLSQPNWEFSDWPYYCRYKVSLHYLYICTIMRNWFLLTPSVKIRPLSESWNGKNNDKRVQRAWKSNWVSMGLSFFIHNGVGTDELGGPFQFWYHGMPIWLSIFYSIKVHLKKENPQMIFKTKSTENQDLALGTGFFQVYSNK